MAEYKILQVKSHDAMRFKERAKRQGIDQYKLFKLMLESYEFNNPLPEEKQENVQH